MTFVLAEAVKNIKIAAADRRNRERGTVVVELDQYKYKISGYEQPMAQIKQSLDLENKKKRIEIYEKIRNGDFG